MAARTYTDHLSQVPLFSACSKRELQRVAKVADEVEITEGRVLLKQDSPAREAFVVIEGTAEVHRNGKRVAQLGAGDCIGELALLDRGTRTASVTATSPMRVLVISSREFTALLEDAPTIAQKLLRTLARRVRELDRKVYT